MFDPTTVSSAVGTEHATSRPQIISVRTTLRRRYTQTHPCRCNHNGIVGLLWWTTPPLHMYLRPTAEQSEHHADDTDYE